MIRSVFHINRRVTIINRHCQISAYADDVELICRSVQEGEMCRYFEEAAEVQELKRNVAKTKYTITGKYEAIADINTNEQCFVKSEPL